MVKKFVGKLIIQPRHHSKLWLVFFRVKFHKLDITGKSGYSYGICQRTVHSEDEWSETTSLSP